MYLHPLAPGMGLKHIFVLNKPIVYQYIFIEHWYLLQLCSSYCGICRRKLCNTLPTLEIMQFGRGVR